MTGLLGVSSHEYTVELRFYGDNIDVANISNYLGLLPTNSLTPRTLNPNSRPIKPFWGYDAQPDREKYIMWNSLEEGFEFVWKNLRSKKSEIVSLSQKFEGIWWCGHFQASFDGGPTLSPSFLAEIASYTLPIYLDCYFVSNKQENASARSTKRQA